MFNGRHGQRGGSMTLDEALAYALKQLNSAPGS
jgi:hypothetical protein